ncbi:PREDICTED: tRNA (adenine(58)-N(1))-methyltransferase catalytic subunit TRMT61A [Nicrophorus vespilloides]|uniref:tRNA (adenine(58)-N(1))-methyltransferase catalytic subunit TRMT61A n=1 Tax=Nicrophorus vespilloides TaxID=110193 RepID=A0ABM1NDV3_NICVS|nr:PREDICTED: tRNA (adenine(58)-N(1))-methyltransferase catalytic subunit TRMT61A [Nicrophorus vespilloides]
MSFDGCKTVVTEGDTVILFLTVNQVYAITAEKKTKNKNGDLVPYVFQTPYGALKGEQLIGKEFGTKILLSKGWGYILQPTPELWTVALRHRTQIIYTPDISMITLQLELKPGSVVIESGTGSGSLSHALIRSVKPHGHLYTFDFHKERADIARQEFQDHGLQEYVTVYNRDVCCNGFDEALDGKVDAVFLDLPHPWLAIPHGVNSFKPEGGRLCSFSPCIEQVQKTCLKLREHHFQEIETLEVLQTQFSVQTRRLASLEMEYLKNPKEENDGDNKCEKQIVSTLTAIPPLSQPGHTGYLTFATMPPIWARSMKTIDDLDNDDNEN